MHVFDNNQAYLDAMDALIREIDAIQSRPFHRIARRTTSVPARSTVSAWIDQFVNLLVTR
jgi:hypothetical protein